MIEYSCYDFFDNSPQGIAQRQHHKQLLATRAQRDPLGEWAHIARAADVLMHTIGALPIATKAEREASLRRAVDWATFHQCWMEEWDEAVAFANIPRAEYRRVFAMNRRALVRLHHRINAREIALALDAFVEDAHGFVLKATAHFATRASSRHVGIP